MVNSQFIQSLPETLKQKFQQPAWVAMAASVGLHLIILLPILTLSSLEPEVEDAPEPVSLTELSPEELARVPDFSASEFDSGFSLDLPPLSQTPDSFSVEPLPNQPPPFNFPSSGLPPLYIPSQPSFPFRAPGAIPRTVPPRTDSRPQVGIPPSQTPTPSSPTPQQTQPPVAGGTAPSRELDELIAGNPPDSSDEPSDAQAPEAEPTPSPEAQNDLIARQEELRQLYSYSPEGTDAGEADAAFGAWLANDLGKAANAYERTEINLDYPPEACPVEVSSDAVTNGSIPVGFGVVVDAEGNLVEGREPQMFQSSGYGIFNQKALEAVYNYEFEATGEETVRAVEVRFPYSSDIRNEVCPEVFTDPPAVY